MDQVLDGLLGRFHAIDGEFVALEYAREKRARGSRIIDHERPSSRHGLILAQGEIHRAIGGVTGRAFLECGGGGL